MVSDLILNGDDLLKIKATLIGGRKVAGMRVMGRPETRGVTSFTLMGNGWTLYGSVETTGFIMEKMRVFALNLIGNRERFEEDFILAKMTIG